MQYGQLGMRDARRHQAAGALEHRRERQLRRRRDARRIVEQLAQQEPHAIRRSPRPGDQHGRERVGGRAVERAHQLVGDRAEHRRVELLLAREVIDDVRERQPRGLRDIAHARAVEARRHELRLGGGDDATSGTLALRRLAAEREHENGTTVL